MSRAIWSRPAARSSVPVVRRRHSAGKDDVGRCDEQRMVLLVGRLVGIDHHRDAARERGMADRGDEIGEAVVDQHRIDARNEAVGIARPRRVQPMVAIGRDGAVAARIDEDRRDRRSSAGDAHAAAAIDAFALQALDQAIPDRVLARRDRRAARQKRTVPPSRAIATAALAAQPPPMVMNSLASTLPSGGGKVSTRNTSSRRQSRRRECPACCGLRENDCSDARQKSAGFCGELPTGIIHLFRGRPQTRLPSLSSQARTI